MGLTMRLYGRPEDLRAMRELILAMRPGTSSENAGMQRAAEAMVWF